jgi:hypothetical protein
MVEKFDYSEILQTADDLIVQFGTDAKLRRASGDRPCKVVRIDWRPQDRDGTFIRQTDIRYLLSPLGLSVDPDSEQDRLIVQGMDLRIVIATPTEPANTKVLWDVQARR